MKKIVSQCQEKGIYVLIEMHQDILASRFCGEGVPDWLLPPPKSYFAFPYPLDHSFTLIDGTPTGKDCSKHSWPRYHFTLELSEAYQGLYDNKHGMLDSFAEYW